VKSPLDRVKDLAELRDRLILTDEEFQTAKTRLLDEALVDTDTGTNRQTEDARDPA
jgi:hypothetical protein